jgi:hypothetical protein
VSLGSIPQRFVTGKLFIKTLQKLLYEVNPYVVDDSVGGVFKKYTDEVLYDKMSVDEACKKIDEELAALIQEGKEIAGIE